MYNKWTHEYEINEHMNRVSTKCSKINLHIKNDIYPQMLAHKCTHEYGIYKMVTSTIFIAY